MLKFSAPAFMRNPIQHVIFYWRLDDDDNLGILDTSQDSSFDREARKISAPAVMQTPTHRTPFLVTPPQQPIQARNS